MIGFKGSFMEIILSCGIAALAAGAPKVIDNHFPLPYYLNEEYLCTF